MRKSKWPQVRDNLHLIEEWARNGLSEKQIAKNLGIGYSTLSAYKIHYPEFLDTLKKGRMLIIAEIENALVKRALGFEYTEVRTYIKREDGKDIRYQEQHVKILSTGRGCLYHPLKEQGSRQLVG